MKKKTLLGFIVGLAVLTGVYFLAQYFLNKSAFEKLLNEEAVAVTKKCPMTVDEDTRLDSCGVSDHKLVYYQTLLSFVKDSTDTEIFKEYITPLLIEKIKKQPELKKIREQNTTVVYSFKDKYAVSLLNIEITANLYNKE